MPKRAAKSAIEIIEVKTPKVDNRIQLGGVMDQLAKKAGGAAPKGGPSARASSAARDRLARIKDLATQLAQELRELPRSPAASAKSRKRGK